MALTKEYFDSIQIAFVKRKYYNANKVHAVFDDIQRQAEELLQENEALRAALSERQQKDSQAEKELEQLQQIYRETLERGRQRSDALIRETEDTLRRQQTEANKATEMASRLMTETVSMLKQREEENTDFLNKQLQRFMSAFDQRLEVMPVQAAAEQTDIGAEVSVQDLPAENEEQTDTPDDQMEDQAELQRKVKELAREIHEMENV